MDRRAALETIRTTLAADYACQPSDWLKDGTTLVEAREVEGRRRFPWRAKAFGMASSNTARRVGYWLAWMEVYVRDQ